MASSDAVAAKRVRDDLAYARFSWFHVKVRREREEKKKKKKKKKKKNKEMPNSWREGITEPSKLRQGRRRLHFEKLRSFPANDRERNTVST
jgi:hypothetical protein